MPRSMTPKDIATVKDALETTEHPMLTSMLYLGRQDAFEAVKIVNKAARAYVETALSSHPAIDDLGELLKRVPEAVEVSLEKLEETWFCGLCKETRFLVLDATGSTPAEAVRKALEIMEDHTNGQ